MVVSKKIAAQRLFCFISKTPGRRCFKLSPPIFFAYCFLLLYNYYTGFEPVFINSFASCSLSLTYLQGE